jgi:hypothetical protein
MGYQNLAPPEPERIIDESYLHIRKGLAIFDSPGTIGFLLSGLLKGDKQLD